MSQEIVWRTISSNSNSWRFPKFLWSWIRTPWNVQSGTSPLVNPQKFVISHPKKKQTSSPKILEVILKTQGSPAIENTIMVRHYSYCLFPKGSSRILFSFVSQIFFFKVMNNYDAFFSQKESYQPWSVDRMTLARPKEKQNVAYHLRNSQMLKKEMLYSATL